MQSTSESLLQQLGSPSDNGDAWGQFVRLYTPLIFYWARKTGLSQHDAADLVQDVMAIVLQKLPGWKYDPEKSFRGWLRIVTLNRYRELARRNRVAIDQNGPKLEALIDPREAESTWDVDYCRQLVESGMELARSDFDPATWTALKLLFSTGRTAASVARETGVSVWTIYAAKSRLMNRLRKDLQGLME